ncbi:DUF2254 family protein [Rhodococcus pyridinivorans]|uniref:DUF2254 family protein n=1 Tax=Rhodococcus pyridinivorans TaxID=103816 RepID=UPI003AAB8AD9
MVVRALSPGINDPTTAVHGLVACTAVLVELLLACLGPYPVRDSDDRARVVIARPTFADLLELVCTQPRLYGAADPDVAEALLSMLHLLARKATTEEHRTAIHDQLVLVRARINDHNGATRRHLERRARDAEEAFAHRWISRGPAPRPSDPPWWSSTCAVPGGLVLTDAGQPTWEKRMLHRPRERGTR